MIMPVKGSPSPEVRGGGGGDPHLENGGRRGFLRFYSKHLMQVPRICKQLNALLCFIKKEKLYGKLLLRISCGGFPNSNEARCIFFILFFLCVFSKWGSSCLGAAAPPSHFHT